MNTLLPRFVLASAMTLCTLTLCGCKSAGEFLAGAEKPSLRVVNASIDGLTTESAALVFDVEVANPYSVPLPLTNVEYALASRGAAFLSGAANVQGTIPAGGKQVFKVPANLRFVEALAALKGVRPGQVVPYAADLGFSVDAPVVGRMKVPVRKEGELPLPAAPDVRIADVRWQNTGLTEASGAIALDVRNTNQFALDLRSLGFDLELGGKSIASGAAPEARSLAPGQTARIELPVKVSLLNAGLGAFSALTGSADKYRVSGKAAVGTPFGPANLGYDSKSSPSAK
ncbi:MAG: LEA type 2 family protein [Phycisphaerales bacterium]